MSVYLQFDSSSRSDAYIQKDLGAGVVYVPNDNYPNNASPPYDPYQQNINMIQTSTNYHVYYKELNSSNNKRTLSFLEHCKERPTNLTYSVESCTLILPANGLVPRTDSDGNVVYVNILDEPYLYVTMLPIRNSEGNLIYSNNNQAVRQATFIMWIDKYQVGTDGSPPIVNPVPRPNSLLSTDALTIPRWIVYKSCMITVMRLDLQSEQWHIRVYDRFGNDVIIGESDNGGAGYAEDPGVDPDLQTMLLVGIRPNYNL